MNRIKRFSDIALDEHKSRFGENFADNKKVLDEISIVRPKGLKNEIAGYITKFIKKEIREEKAKQARIEAAKSEQQAEIKSDKVITDTRFKPVAKQETKDAQVPVTEPIQDVKQTPASHDDSDIDSTPKPAPEQDSAVEP